VNIDPDFEVKEVLVAGDKSAPRSLAQFKVEYGTANNTMINWTNSNNDGTYEGFTGFSAYPPANERNFRFWFRPPAGQVVEVADVQLMAVDLKPHRVYTINLDNAGSISPAGTLRYSKNNTDSATYTFNPPAGQQVANVIVDGVSLGAMTSYTFNAISASHTIAVSFTGSVPASSVASSSAPSSTPSSVSSSSAPASVLVSQGRPVTASTSFQPAANAVDGVAGTRWESNHGVSPSWLMVDLGSNRSLTQVVIDWEAANAANYEVQGSTNGTSWTTLKTVTGAAFGNRTDTHVVSGAYRYVRVYATARSTGNTWGYSIFELKVFAQNAAASSSSASSTATPALLTPVSANASTALTAASNAIDKNGGTRWESAHAIDPSWITFDLGSAKTLTQIAIDWEAANAANYTVQGSNDNANWVDIASRTGGAFGTRTDTLTLSGNYRYVRINGTARSAGNQWGYSIWEVRLTGF
jgi:hypothetical protein